MVSKLAELVVGAMRVTLVMLPTGTYLTVPFRVTVIFPCRRSVPRLRKSWSVSAQSDIKVIVRFCGLVETSYLPRSLLWISSQVLTGDRSPSFSSEAMFVELAGSQSQLT